MGLDWAFGLIFWAFVAGMWVGLWEADRRADQRERERREMEAYRLRWPDRFR